MVASLLNTISFTFPFLGNLVFGLGGTQALSLPMMISLRRFTILMVMAAELVLFGTRPSKFVLAAVGMMVGGALVAASNDLAFNLKVQWCSM